MSPVILEVDTSPVFTFLAPPSPPKKKRASVNDTFRTPTSYVQPSRAILAWVSDVHPGSPAPITPTSGVPVPRSTSFVHSPLLHAFRHSSLDCANSCSQSVGSIRKRITSASFLRLVDPPRTPAHPVPATPFLDDAKVDLKAFGYASAFVDIPVSTPITPEIYKPKLMTRIPSRHEIIGSSLPTTPPPKSKAPGMFKRLLSTRFKPKSQGQTNRAAENEDAGNSDSASDLRSAHRTYAEGSFIVVEKQKRELYAGVLPSIAKQEAQIRQRVHPEFDVQRIVEGKAMQEEHAIRINVVDEKNGVEGIGIACRGNLVGNWWNQEEEWEFAHFLPPTNVPLSAQYPDAEGWITYNHLKELERDGSSEFYSLPSSDHTDSYHSRPLLVTDEAEQLARGCAMRCSSVAGSIVLPSPSAKPSNILLAVPSRPKRGRHLKPGFLKDVLAVPPTPITPSAYSQISRPPRSPACATRFIVNTSANPDSVRPKKISLRRRQRKPVPPPLEIIPICSVNKLAVNSYPEEDHSKMFLGNSSSELEPYVMTSRWSRDTTALELPRGVAKKANGFASVDGPKKSRRLGGFFKKGEKVF
ncbi:hypothetical protein BJ322DRAFT_451923 [Thelephora terrestris]|uniref:Uncharacterized protein n=1 Tax=Thelephora terrestris TaxID=56493 RepID=A0A9P6L2F4_9AGAM|nr:hypothetical protein BJ322DRAFT_451923 [Thelephora terrestris]